MTIAAALVAAALAMSAAQAQDKSIVVASTTSTQDSGLFGYLLPIVKAKTGIEVRTPWDVEGADVLLIHNAGEILAFNV